MKKLLITSLIILLTSCSTFRVSSVYYDPIYGPEGTEITTDVIDNEFQLTRKLQTDFTFRYNFAQYAMNQPYSWYFNNRTLNRYNMWNPYSRFDMYANSGNFWMNWAFDYPYSNFGYNWRDPFGFNNLYPRWQSRYAFGWNSWNYRPYQNQFRIYNHRTNRNVSYNRGRRGSSNNNRNVIRSTVTENNRINIRTNIPRNPKTSTAGSTLNIDNVVEIIRKENKGRQIRVYTNPNNVPNVIIRGNNSRNNNTRINRRPINRPTSSNFRSNNNSVRSTPNVRSNSSSSRSSNSSTRSSSRSSRGGRGINNN